MIFIFHLSQCNNIYVAFSSTSRFNAQTLMAISKIKTSNTFSGCVCIEGRAKVKNLRRVVSQIRLCPFIKKQQPGLYGQLHQHQQDIALMSR